MTLNLTRLVDSILARAGRLTAATFIVALLLLAPAWLLYQASGIEAVLWAGLLCLVPGWVVLLVNSRASAGGRELLVLLLSMGTRMATVLAGVLVIREFRPDLQQSGFLWWLTVLYLVTLAVETKLVLSVSTDTRQKSALAARN